MSYALLVDWDNRKTFHLLNGAVFNDKKTALEYADRDNKYLKGGRVFVVESGLPEHFEYDTHDGSYRRYCVHKSKYNNLKVVTT